MPYKVKKIGNKHCVYKKTTGKKVGCTTKKNLKKYLAALHLNHKKKLKEQLVNGIRSLIIEILNEDQNVIMRSKVVNGKIDAVLNQNVGIPFDDKEKQTIIFKQDEVGIKPVILKNNTEIKFSISDQFGNNKVNVIKKLKNMSDSSTLVYACFFSIMPEEIEIPEPPKPGQQPEQPDAEAEKKKEENKVHIKLSQPFNDKSSDKLDILGDFIQQLEL